MKYYAGLDIGGTTGRIRISDMSGSLIGEFQCGGCSIHEGAEERAKRKYRELVTPVLLQNGLVPEECEKICVAASGVDSENLREQCKRCFVEMGFEESKVVVFNDCEIFLQFYEKPSLILVAGTGSISFGMNKNGNVCRTGGWGHILSDEGSGFDIGMQVIKAVGNHLDRRKKEDILYQLFYDRTRISDLESLNNFVNQNVMTKTAVAGLAPLAGAAAERGSETAEEIQQETAEKLFRLVWDNYNKMGTNPQEMLTVILWGGVILKNTAVKELVVKKIEETIPNVRIAVPEKPAVEIALKAAMS